jgi:hypothetical protein
VWVTPAFKLKDSIFNANFYTKKKPKAKLQQGCTSVAKIWRRTYCVTSKHNSLPYNASFGAAGLRSVVAVIVVMGVVVVVVVWGWWWYWAVGDGGCW